MVTVIGFDVNETLLDLKALDPPFEELFGAPGLRQQWFAQMLQLAFVGGLTGEYVDFSTAQHAALLMLARRVGGDVSDSDAAAMVGRMSTLPPYPEVDAALRALKDSPLKVAALTNSVQSVVEAQLVAAGLHDCFDLILSADSVRQLKPGPEPYRALARAAGVEVSEVRLVAAHAWDVTGALAAGCAAAFVARPGMVLSPVGPQPDVIATDISDVVDQILSRDLQT